MQTERFEPDFVELIFLQFSYCGILSTFYLVGFCPVGFCPKGGILSRIHEEHANKLDISISDAVVMQSCKLSETFSLPMSDKPNVYIVTHLTFRSSLN